MKQGDLLSLARDRAIAKYTAMALAGGPYIRAPEPDDVRTADELLADAVGDSRGLGWSARDPDDRHPQWAAMRACIREMHEGLEPYRRRNAA